ncbi:MAG: hypothetical protein L6Q78_13745 [Bacteroidia bacterium]|nr:hypothetical protein [Bacteroidia bacterium]
MIQYLSQLNKVNQAAYPKFMNKVQISPVNAQSDAAALEAWIVSKGLDSVFRNFPM